MKPSFLPIAEEIIFRRARSENLDAYQVLELIFRNLQREQDNRDARVVCGKACKYLQYIRSQYEDIWMNVRTYFSGHKGGVRFVTLHVHELALILFNAAVAEPHAEFYKKGILFKAADYLVKLCNEFHQADDWGCFTTRNGGRPRTVAV